MTEPKRELQAVLDEIHNPGSTGRVDAVRKYLRLVRELRLRQPENVAMYGSQLLRDFRGRLTAEELWLTMEQVAIAALDTRSFDLAFSIVQQVRSQFPDSLRAARLTEMYFEARGLYEDADGLLQKHLEERPDCQMLLKRQIALEKTKGDSAKAIDLLRRYVDIFMTDADAWAELAEMYVQAQMYPQAAFCCEELLLHSPPTIAVYVLYADILYTIGSTVSNYRAARSYYAAALELSSGSNVRAMYGVTACTAQLQAGGIRGRLAKDDDEAGVQLANLTASALLRRYQEEAPDKLPYVKALLQAQGRPTK